MLTELRIRNFAIIETLDLTFNKGMNVMTGETGAGKSIIIEAVNLILGDRAASNLIRSGEKEAVVEALFRLEESGKIKERLEKFGIEATDEVVIRRVITERKNKVFINGVMATLAMLTEVCEGLINISSQHEHQALLKPDNHLPLVDSFGRLDKEKKNYSVAYGDWLALKRELDRIKKEKAGRAEKIDLVSFQLGEITRAEIKPDEDEALMKERDILANAEKLSESAAFADQTLYSSEDSLVEKLGEVVAKLKEVSTIDPLLKKNGELLEGVLFQIEDAAMSLRDYAGKITFNPEKLDAISGRLAELERLKKKHGPALSDVIKKGEDLTKELESIGGGEGRIEELEAELRERREEALKQGRALSEQRRTVAGKLSTEMAAELLALGMSDALLEVNFVPLDEMSPFGLEQAEFFLSTNPGEKPRPLAKIASGGELSRIMLALKRLILNEERVPSLIFDEVDAGIGGGTAEVVGRKLKEVSKSAQVICITHLPQIAALGDTHYKVAKTVQGGRTFTTIDVLDDVNRVEEISRMLGGVEITEMTKEHAREMLEKNA